MSILWVVPSLAVAILLFALAYGQMRRPDPAGIFRAESTASAFAYVITALTSFAIIGTSMGPEALWLAFLGLPRAFQVALVALPAGALALAPVLMRPAFRPAGSAAASAEIVPLPPRGPSRAGQGVSRPGGKPRRAA